MSLVTNAPRQHKIQHDLPQPLAGITSKKNPVFFSLWIWGFSESFGFCWKFQALKFVSAKKKGKHQQHQHELVVSIQLEQILVKIGNLPPIFGVNIKQIWNHHLARTLKPKRHIQHRKHYVILHVILVTNWCAEKPSICHEVPYLPLCVQLKPRKKTKQTSIPRFFFVFVWFFGWQPSNPRTIPKEMKVFAKLGSRKVASFPGSGVRWSPDLEYDFFLSSWWFQPIWKILVKLDHFPR